MFDLWDSFERDIDCRHSLNCFESFFCAFGEVHKSAFRLNLQQQNYFFQREWDVIGQFKRSGPTANIKSV